MKKKQYPSKYFLERKVIQKANRFGLTDIENGYLTTAGLIAKMKEWQKKYGGVDKYVYDLTEKDLQERGSKMPKEIRFLRNRLYEKHRNESDGTAGL